MRVRDKIMRVLLIKLSSMGDLIHALPAISDAKAVMPEICFDWVIDESFAEVAGWHSAVQDIIPTAHRRWRKHKWQTLQSGELRKFLKNLRKTSYDFVIDGQTNFKSALITRFSKGLRCGLDRDSAREFVAHYAYQKQIFVPKQEHAVKRMRMLFADVFNYPYQDTEPDFAIERSRLVVPNFELPDKFLMFMHNASWESKLWPENYWIELLKMAVAADYSVLLPSGNADEQARAERLAKLHPKVHALPRMSLSEVAYVISQARGAVSNDTGLGHLTAALNIPSVNLYGATDSALIGAPGKVQIYLQAEFPCAPCYKKQCIYRGPTEETPACFTKIPPALVWEKLMALI